MRKFAAALAFIMALCASGCNSETDSEISLSVIQGSAVRVESEENSSAVSWQTTPAHSTASSETSAAGTSNFSDISKPQSTQASPDSGQSAGSSESAGAEDKPGVLPETGAEEVNEPVKSSEPYTRDTLISDVIKDPVFGNYGRLIFPVDTGYYSGETLGGLSLTWYNNIAPDKTVEIADYMRSHAESGDVIFTIFIPSRRRPPTPGKMTRGCFSSRELPVRNLHFAARAADSRMWGLCRTVFRTLWSCQSAVTMRLR